jgi:Photosynthesis system II assembly factor YCF48
MLRGVISARVRDAKVLRWLAAAAMTAIVAAGCGGGSTTSSTDTDTVTRTSTVTVTGAPVTAPACPAVTVHDSTYGAGVLNDVQFVSATRGWAVGSDRILATVDGGAHWTRQFGGDVQIQHVDFIDADHGWALGNTVLLYTTDGGGCWRAAGEPAQPLSWVHFTSATLGFGISGHSLVTTTDGGLSWSRLGGPPHPTSVCFSTSSDGWLGTARLGVYRSDDGGHAWDRVFRDTADQRFTVDGETVVQCAGPGVWVRFDGFGSATGSSPYVDYASAGGAHFTAVAGHETPDAPRSTDPGSYPGPISALSANAAMVSGVTPPEQGYGVSYTALVSGTSGGPVRPITGMRYIRGLSFIDASTGWAVGDSGSNATIVHTRDGGAHWTIQKTILHR